MNFKQITGNKKRYLDLLLLADEQESMIDRYLERGGDVSFAYRRRKSCLYCGGNR